MGSLPTAREDQQRLITSKLSLRTGMSELHFSVKKGLDDTNGNTSLSEEMGIEWSMNSVAERPSGASGVEVVCGWEWHC